MATEYTISFGHRAGDNEQIWDRNEGDYHVPQDSIDYARSLIRAYFPQGGTLIETEGWWYQTTEPCTTATMVGADDIDWRHLAWLIARACQQDAVYVKVARQTGEWAAYLVTPDDRITVL